MELSEFLLARIAEDEATARYSQQQQRSYVRWSTPWDTFNPARVLAECEAKRRIVDRWKRADESAGAYPGTDAGIEIGLYEALQYLALAYADHPDYEQEWKP